VVAAYPQIIKKDNQVAQAVTVGPALILLADRSYKTANAEYLDALADYRTGDYGDCLTKCGSALESTMKIICSRKKWAYNQTDAAAKLLDIIRANANIESYLIETFKVVAMLRNKQSNAHGAGMQPKTVSVHTAQYALSATAAAICFLVEETK
jgi:hypothetical protein